MIMAMFLQQNVTINKVENGYTWSFQGKTYIEVDYDTMAANIKLMLEPTPPTTVKTPVIQEPAPPT
jgi:hypothetical protein